MNLVAAVKKKSQQIYSLVIIEGEIKIGMITKLHDMNRIKFVTSHKYLFIQSNMILNYMYYINKSNKMAIMNTQFSEFNYKFLDICHLTKRKE